MKSITKLICMAAIMLTASAANAAEKAKYSEDITIKIWDDSTAPHASNLKGEEYESDPGIITDVTETELYIYEADRSKNTGKAVVVLPGGGYGKLSITNEGQYICEWFAKQGITAALLKYRMPNGVKEVPFEDAVEALRIMRQRSRQLGFAPNQVGIVGFSAGGHLAASVSVLAEVDQKPNFSILFYPVISSEKGLAHEGSFNNLLGKDRSAALTADYSLEKHVNSDTPPAILFHCNDDKTVPPANSPLYYTALRDYDRHSALYVFPEGGHGWGFDGERCKYKPIWQELLLDWIEKLK